MHRGHNFILVNLAAVIADA